MEHLNQGREVSPGWGIQGWGVGCREFICKSLSDFSAKIVRIKRSFAEALLGCQAMPQCCSM